MKNNLTIIRNNAGQVIDVLVGESQDYTKIEVFRNQESKNADIQRPTSKKEAEIEVFRKKYPKECRECGAPIRRQKILCDSCRVAIRKATQGKYKAGTNAAKKRLTRYKAELKKQGCAVCGYNKCPLAIDFHHMRGSKTMSINRIGSIARLKKEILDSDLILLCATHHREVHARVIDENDYIDKVLTIC